MMLWTWQTPDFDPFTDRVDRSKSEWMKSRHNPDLIQAYAELDGLLDLTKKDEHQWLWCCTADCWHHHPWTGRLLWTVDVPSQAVISFVKGAIWERLIGNQTVPTRLQDNWRKELWSHNIIGDAHQKELERRKREYAETCPPRDELLRTLLISQTSSEEDVALVRMPLCFSWVRPYDLWQRQRKNRYRRTRSPAAKIRNFSAVAAH